MKQTSESGEENSDFLRALAPLNVPAAYQHVVDRLKRSMWLGQILPDDKLPSERALAEALGVSRVTVREALRVLQGEGLISTSRGRNGGTVVENMQLSAAEQRTHLHHSYENMKSVYELRLAVEPMASALAARRSVEEDIARLQLANRKLLESSSVSLFRRADSEFHLALATASRNPYLFTIIEDARSKIFLVLDVVEFDIKRETTNDAHQKIIDAIVDGSENRAFEMMRQHIDSAWHEILTAMEIAP